MSRLMSYDNARADRFRRDDSPGKHDYAFVRRRETRDERYRRRERSVERRGPYTDFGLPHPEILIEEDDEDDSADDDTIYAQPVGRDGRKLVSYYDLGIETFVSSQPKQRQDEDMGTSASGIPGPATRLDVSNSTSKSDASGNSPIEVIYDSRPKTSSKYLYRWVHHHEERLCMSRFESLIFKSLGLTHEESKTVAAALTRAQNELEKDYIHGKYMSAGVVRCNGHSDKSSPVRTSATFVSMPHFKIAKQDNGTKASKSAAPDHPIRTLLQSAYGTQSTADRNHDQFLSAGENSKTSQTIHVPNLWLLLVNEGFVVTYGYIDFDVVTSPNIKCSLNTRGNTSTDSSEDDPKDSAEESQDPSMAPYQQAEKSKLRAEERNGSPVPMATKLGLRKHRERSELRSPFVVRPLFAYHRPPGDEMQAISAHPRTTELEAMNYVLDHAAIAIADRVLNLDDIRSLPLREAKYNGKELFNKQRELERLDYLALWAGIKLGHESREAFMQEFPTYQDFLDHLDTLQAGTTEGAPRVTESSQNTTEGASRATESTQNVTEGASRETEPSPDTTQGASRETEPSQKTELRVELPTTDVVSDKDHEHVDYYAHYAKQHMTEQVETCMKAMDEICSAHIPLTFPHSLLYKIWGSMSVLIMLCNDASRSKSSIHHEARDGWSVRTDRVLGLDDDIFAHIPKPTKDWRACKACASGKVYASPRAVRQHLHSVHFEDRLSRRREPATAFWIISTEQAMEHRRLHQYVFLLEIVNECLENMLLSVRTAGRILRTRLIGGRSVEGSHLPASLIKAFEELVVFILITSLAFSSTKLKTARWNKLSHAFGDIADVKAYARTINANGIRAGNAFNYATREVVLLMLDPKITGKVDKTIAVGIGHLAHSIIGNVLSTPLWNGKGLVDTYRNFVSSQYYQVYNRTPQRRRLEEIQALQEEIGMVLAKYDEQRGALEDLLSVLEPADLKKTSKARYRRIERLNEQMTDQISQDEQNLSQLVEILQELEVKARYRIEVLEEDNSKTIFVFTVVTAVFLPLSFVTSFLGMNTKDIRDLDSTQALFWEIGIPITAIIIVIIVFWAHNSDKFSDWWLQLLPGKKRRRRDHLNATTTKKVEPGKSSTMNTRAVSRGKKTSMDAMDEV